MQCVYAVREDFVETTPFHRKGVAVEPEDVIRVNLADSLFDAVVEEWKTDVLRVTRLV
jgi:hypothetical protein